MKDAFDAGVMPRCHLEDITRADFYGFVVPFVNELMELSHQAKIPVRIRACDTMGYGVPYTEVALPRSVPGIIYGLQHYSGVESEYLEWHGHNDFYKAVANAATAWLYGASGVNCRLRSDHQLSKHDALVEKLKVWVDEQYAGGRTTALSNEELEEKIAELSGGVLKPRH